MKWTKMGRIELPLGDVPWRAHSALQPTPLRLSDREIRMYVGFRDANGVSRIGFVDLDADNPANVLRISERPVLDIGEPGAFDDNGVVPSAVVRHGDQVWLYYAGYQLGVKVRFHVLGGLAVSHDGGTTFTRVQPTPVLERTPDELCFRVAHSVRIENGVWRVWYGGGSHWLVHQGKTVPVYDVRYVESHDGIHFGAGEKCLPLANSDEHRVARPYVVQKEQRYHMFLSVGTLSSGYRLGYARSEDGRHWQRCDNELGIGLSSSGWDSEMMAYSSVVEHRNSAWLFYNGNQYGAAGFGFARLDSW